jgi:hypothetical protein
MDSSQLSLTYVIARSAEGATKPSSATVVMRVSLDGFVARWAPRHDGSLDTAI